MTTRLDEIEARLLAATDEMDKEIARLREWLHDCACHGTIRGCACHA